MMSKEIKLFNPDVRLFVCIPIIVIGVLADMVVRGLPSCCLRTGHIRAYSGILRLTYAKNEGAAFSILSGQREFFIALTAVVLVVAFYMLLRGYIRGMFGAVAISICISGAIGNFIDRLFYGYVIDMFEPIFIDFAVFNVADVLLNVGGAALVIYILFFHKEAARIDIKSSDFLYISAAGSRMAKLCLYDGKIGFEIKEYGERAGPGTGTVRRIKAYETRTDCV